jgi:hypothetical protein
LRKLLPDFIRSVIRFLYYKNERRKVFSNFHVRKEQNLRIKLLSSKTKNLIIFIVPGADWFSGKDKISGGILSISSIFEETAKLNKIHGAEAIMCTLPGEFLLMRHTMFPNEIDVFRFKQIRYYFRSVEKILFHVPEYMVPTFKKSWGKEKKKFNGVYVHVNILNQRIDIMPTPAQITDLGKLVDKMTQTTAHENYTTEETREKYGIPVHKLSVFGSPERYKHLDFKYKNPFITFSPDPHKGKESLIHLIEKQFPQFTIREVRNLAYIEYLSWIADTKFTITLGEGLDFYFIETVFSGGVAFALDKGDFFTKDFNGVPGIFKSIDDMLNQLPDCIAQLNDPVVYRQWNDQQFKACAKLYKYREYVENLKKFYCEEYTFA